LLRLFPKESLSSLLKFWRLILIFWIRKMMKGGDLTLWFQS